MPYYSEIILDSFYNQLFQHNRRMPTYVATHNHSVLSWYAPVLSW